MNQHPSRFYAVIALCLLGLSSCGLETYEQRLEATRSYYAYLDKLDQNLKPPWKSPPVESLRVPLQFNEIPAPQPVEGPDGKPEPPEVDPRQPDYIQLVIPGLIGAWKADAEAPAYLYAATNHLMLLTDASEAAYFKKQLVAELEAALQSGEARSDLPAAFPKGHQFTLKQTFDVHSLKSAIEIHGTRYVFEVYSTQLQDNQVAIIFAGPEGLDPQSKIPERIQLMLESLRVSGAPPQPTQPGQGGGGAPAGPGPKPGDF